MGVMMTKDIKDNSELNRRISSDLRAKATNSSLYDDDKDPSDDSEQGTSKKTGKFTWVWIVLIVLAIISLICIAFI